MNDGSFTYLTWNNTCKKHRRFYRFLFQDFIEELIGRQISPEQLLSLFTDLQMKSIML